MAEEIQRLRNENTQLRKALLLNGRAARIAERAYRDATLFIGDIMAGLPVSQYDMNERHGMTRRRWEWARALQKLASVANAYGLLTVFEPTQANRQLLRAREVATGDLGALKACLPRSRRDELT
jgi:hypothetical protein